MSDPILVVARAQVPVENRDRFVEGARDCMAEARQEQGCLAYDMFESATTRGSFVVVGSWETRSDIDRHMTTPHLRAFLDLAGACVLAPPVVEVVELRSVDRL